MANVASGRTVFVLGKELHKNRQVLIVEDGKEYSVSFEYTNAEYSAQEARFPYEL